MHAESFHTGSMLPAALPPLISAQLNYLLTHSPLSVKVDQIWSGCKNSRYSDRFTLLIPYCLDYIKWDVIYNAQYPLAAPDVIFAPEEDSFHPLQFIGEGQQEIQTTKSSLCDWNIKDPSKLLSLIHELRDLYMTYQRKRVGEIDDERLKFETSTIHSRQGIEVCTISGPERPEEVKFAVPLLDMDLNKMVQGCPWRHQQKICLQVIFPVSRKYFSAPSAPRLKLISSSEIKTLFSVEDVKLPAWPDGMQKYTDFKVHAHLYSQQNRLCQQYTEEMVQFSSHPHITGTSKRWLRGNDNLYDLNHNHKHCWCMAEYLPTLEENLKAQVLEAIASVGARRRFIESLAPLFGRPVEADPVFCRKATVLSVSGVFTFLVHFVLPTQFPKQKPVLMLQTSQHFDSQGTPVMSPPITNYPWSPRWEPSQMVERIFEFLVEECLSFKKYCSDTLLQQH